MEPDRSELWLLQSAFNIAPPHTSPRAITAAELVAGIVLGMLSSATASRVPGSHPARSPRLIALLIGVILVARSPVLSRRHRSRPPPGFELHPARKMAATGSWRAR
jgi:hypothetical protein